MQGSTGIIIGGLYVNERLQQAEVHSKKILSSVLVTLQKFALSDVLS